MIHPYRLKQKKLSLAIAAALSALAPLPAVAVMCPINVPTSSVQWASGDCAVNSLVTVNGVDVPITNSGGTLGTLTNRSTITGTTITFGYSTMLFSNASVAALINSQGGVISAPQYIAIENVSGSIGTISNAAGGTITAGITAISNELGGTIGALSNSGVISGGNIGIQNDGSFIHTVTNDGTIYGGTQSSSAYSVATTGLSNLFRAQINTIDNNGTIGGDGSGVYNAGSIGTLSNGTTGTINSVFGTVSGTIGSIANVAIGIANDASGTITALNNSGYIGGNGEGIQNFGAIGTLTNNGTIYGGTHATGVTNDGIAGLYNAGGGIGTLNNNGVIGGDFAGVNVQGGTIGALNNAATGTLSGIVGINNESGGTIATLSNSGLITGTNAGISNSATINALTNTGTITVPITSAGSSAAIVNSSGLIGTLSNSGTLSGPGFGVQNAGTINTLVNSGTISGAVTGISNTTRGTIASLVNSGLITGNQSAISSADGGVFRSIVNSGTIAGNINHGGTDTLFISGGTGSTFGTLTGFGGAIGTLTANEIYFLGGNLLLNDNLVGKTSNRANTLQVNNTVTVTGNYVQYQNGTLSIGVNNGAVASGSAAGDSGYGRLVVSGSAYIESGSSVRLQPTTTYAFASGQRFVVIDAASTGTNYNSFGLQYSATGFDGTIYGLVSTADGRSALVLTLVSDSSTTTPSTNPPAQPKALATTPNAISALAGLAKYTGISDPGLLNLFNAGQALNLGSTAAANRAGAQLNPSARGATSQAVAAPTFSVLNIVSGRSDGLRLAKADGGSASGVATGESPQAWGVWGQAFGGHASQSERDMIDGYSANFGGFLIGADRAINDAWRAGGVFSFSNTTINSTGNTDGNRTSVNAYGLIGYASYLASTWYANLSAGVVQQRYDTSRAINFTGFSGNANGQFNGTQYVARAEAGYPLALPFATVTPLASLTYSYLHQGAYTESGGNGAALAVGSENTTSVTSDLGVKLSRDFPTTYGTLVPELQLVWRHQYNNSRTASNARFVADPTGSTAFTSLGARPVSDLAVVSAGLTLLRANNLSVTARYELQAGGGLVSQAGTLRLRQLF